MDNFTFEHLWGMLTPLGFLLGIFYGYSAFHAPLNFKTVWGYTVLGIAGALFTPLVILFTLVGLILISFDPLIEYQKKHKASSEGASES